MSFFSDILSVPTLSDDRLSESISDLTTMDLESFAFRRGKDPMKLSLYNNTSSIVALAPELAASSQDSVALEVPSWDPVPGLDDTVVSPQPMGTNYQHQLQDNRFPSPTPSMSSSSSSLGEALSPLQSQMSASSDDGGLSSSASSPDPMQFEELSAPVPAPATPPTVRRQRTIPTEPSSESRDGFLVDLEAEDDMLMTPEEEARLRVLLQRKQLDLENCTSKMKGLTPQNKKRLRNRHASCVSRLKKKLYICNLQRDLEKAKGMLANLQVEMEGRENTLALLQRENARLKALQQRRA